MAKKLKGVTYIPPQEQPAPAASRSSHERVRPTATRSIIEKSFGRTALDKISELPNPVKVGSLILVTVVPSLLGYDRFVASPRAERAAAAAAVDAETKRVEAEKARINAQTAKANDGLNLVGTVPAHWYVIDGGDKVVVPCQDGKLEHVDPVTGIDGMPGIAFNYRVAGGKPIAKVSYKTNNYFDAYGNLGKVDPKDGELDISITDSAVKLNGIAKDQHCPLHPEMLPPAPAAAPNAPLVAAAGPPR